MSNMNIELIKAREEYINMVKAELLGPGSEFSFPDVEHELISGSPVSRYSMGILFPKGTETDTCGEDYNNNDDVTMDDESDDSTEKSSKKDSDRKKKKNLVDDDNEEDSEEDSEENDDFDRYVCGSSKFKMSSFGITFIVKGDISRVNVDVDFATYRNALIKDMAIPVSNREYFKDKLDNYEVPSILSSKFYYDKATQTMRLQDTFGDDSLKYIRDIFERDTLDADEAAELRLLAYKFFDYCRNGHVRVPHRVQNLLLDFSNKKYLTVDSNDELKNNNVKLTAVCVPLKDGKYSITIMLVNENSSKSLSPSLCVFQPTIKIYNNHKDSSGFYFVEKGAVDSDCLDDEDLKLEMLYRNKKIYGTGLGTGVDWDIDEKGIGSIWNDFMPVNEIPPMQFGVNSNCGFENKSLSMKYLSDLDEIERKEKCSSLRLLVDSYRLWTESQKNKIKDIDVKYHTVALQNISDCEQAYKRMYKGLVLLESNDKIYNAFMLANRAMFMQRVHLRMQADMANRDRYPKDEELKKHLESINYYSENDDNCYWRPFQIAFILMNINSITDDSSDERDLVDLIWFPTGGGKTEAYLGLTAFTIFYRRMVHSDCAGGTAVLMRYTLRLLTSQQFTRAATLICACEFIRTEGKTRPAKYPVYELGEEPITIGLWIGGKHIPNTNVDAKKELDDLEKNSTVNSLENGKAKHNKFQLLKCPWCGAKLVKDVCDNKSGRRNIIGLWGYGYNKSKKSFYLKCTHDSCCFRQKLPIQIIDEEMYKNPPTLLFGTVDKFAMLPWRGEISNFFGLNSKNRTPELIIQDELHLISGALGSIVGLYETVIDTLCSIKGVKPKLIASTATIRRAKEQCAALYNREVIQFPAPGLSSEDSFFAREAKIDYSKGVFGRKYVGIMPSGKARITVEAHIIATLSQCAALLNLNDNLKDKFWTLTVYFNSLKDLGVASMLVRDQVKDDILSMSKRVLRNKRIVYNAEELTSRVTTMSLNRTLDMLEKKKYSVDNAKTVCDVLLASNMISVGIDVARLNIMLMEGQPKMTSEYIQASSRIGRSYPGIAFVQYDSTHSRDRSHYEQFKQYHDSFYRFVEPTSVTPFSKPALERALHAVFLSIMRSKKGLNKDDDAIKFDATECAETVQDVRIYIETRIRNVNNSSQYKISFDDKLFNGIIENFVYEWDAKAKSAREKNEKLIFGLGEIHTYNECERLIKPFYQTNKDNAYETLTSMRNVSPSVQGVLILDED